MFVLVRTERDYVDTSTETPARQAEVEHAIPNTLDHFQSDDSNVLADTLRDLTAALSKLLSEVNLVCAAFPLLTQRALCRYLSLPLVTKSWQSGRAAAEPTMPLLSHLLCLV
jgi:hypothetical protein